MRMKSHGWLGQGYMYVCARMSFGLLDSKITLQSSFSRRLKLTRPKQQRRLRGFCMSMTLPVTSGDSFVLIARHSKSTYPARLRTLWIG
ncbi:hypothetical protein RB213_015098, partial [Colletotrichum asianum]